MNASITSLTGRIKDDPNAVSYSEKMMETKNNILRNIRSYTSALIKSNVLLQLTEGVATLNKKGKKGGKKKARINNEVSADNW